MITGRGRECDLQCAKAACRFDIVRQLFRKGLLPCYDGSRKNLVKWINERYIKAQLVNFLRFPPLNFIKSSKGSKRRIRAVE